MRIDHIEALPLSVPLVEPFVIATGRVESTRAVLVRTLVRGADGAIARGLGEAAALPPVTREDQPELLHQLSTLASQLVGFEWTTRDELGAQLDRLLGDRLVARAGLECALLDAWARLEGRPLCRWLSGAPPLALVSDITLPIAAPTRMAELAAERWAQGFRVFKVKIGKSIDDDVEALSAIATRVPSASFRFDANAGFDAAQAVHVLEAARAADLHVECFEQPCGRDDLEGMARVRAASGDVPVVADESVCTLSDLDRVIDAGAADGVNLKLAKSGGLLAALAIGQRARQHGLSVMCGGMVETRLGMTAMGHVACALGGVDFVDLDTAFLLADDPFDGGYRSRGPVLQFLDGPGHGVSLRR